MKGKQEKKQEKFYIFHVENIGFSNGKHTVSMGEM